jgi:hypothetical protein
MFRNPCMRCMGEHQAKKIIIKDNEYIGEVMAVDIMSTTLAFMLAVIWFSSRNISPYAFVLQVILLLLLLNSKSISKILCYFFVFVFNSKFFIHMI